MSLKTDYKDDKFAGMRKYSLINNSDGTISLDDVTAYVEEGDVFSAHDINTTNNAVNKNTDDIVKAKAYTDSEITKAKAYTDSEITKAKAYTDSEITKASERLTAVRYARFLAGGWSSSIPYKQTVTVNGLESSFEPTVSLYIPSTGITANDSKNMSKAYGFVGGGDTGNNTLTLYCYAGKPASDFQVMIKGE